MKELTYPFTKHMPKTLSAVTQGLNFSSMVYSSNIWKLFPNWNVSAF